MNVWHDIQQEDITSGTFWVYITMQKGSNKKYKFDVNTGCLRLEEMLYSASCHPVNGASCIIQISGIPRKKVEKKIPQCKIRLLTLDG